MEEPRKLADVAARSAKILLDTETWIHRRVYMIGYTDSGLMRTNVSVDLTIDPRLVPFLDGTGSEPSVFFAPIMMLRKWPPLMRFDVRSQEGCPLPLLTSGKNREVDAAVLEMLAPAGDLKDAAAPTLRLIATSDKEEATARVNALGKVVLDAAPDLVKDWWKNGPFREIDTCARALPSERAPATAPGPAISRRFRSGIRREHRRARPSRRVADRR
jgi:hypothetical protein